MNGERDGVRHTYEGKVKGVSGERDGVGHTYDGEVNGVSRERDGVRQTDGTVKSVSGERDRVGHTYDGMVKGVNARRHGCLAPKTHTCTRSIDCRPPSPGRDNTGCSCHGIKSSISYNDKVGSSSQRIRSHILQQRIY